MKVAFDIHELLDIPLDSHNDPDVGSKIIGTILKCVEEALRRGESVSIRGFGTFRVVAEAGARRTGNNFARQSGERYATALQHLPKRRVRFYPSEQLLAMLNANTDNTWDEKRAISIWNKE